MTGLCTRPAAVKSVDGQLTVIPATLTDFTPGLLFKCLKRGGVQKGAVLSRTCFRPSVQCRAECPH